MKFTSKYDIKITVGSDVRCPSRVTDILTLSKGSEIDLSVARDGTTWIESNGKRGKPFQTDRTKLLKDHGLAIPWSW